MSRERDWVTCEEVADYIGVTRQTVWLWIKKGKLKAHKINKKIYRIELKDFIEFGEGGRRERSNHQSRR